MWFTIIIYVNEENQQKLHPKNCIYNNIILPHPTHSNNTYKLQNYNDTTLTQNLKASNLTPRALNGIKKWFSETIQHKAVSLL